MTSKLKVILMLTVLNFSPSFGASFMEQPDVPLQFPHLNKTFSSNSDKLTISKSVRPTHSEESLYRCLSMNMNTTSIQEDYAVTRASLALYLGKDFSEDNSYEEIYKIIKSFR